MNVNSVIKSIRNIMRQDKGVNGDAQRLEQLGWMLFLKIFDAKDEDLEDMDETGEYVSPVPEKYQWINWAADDEGITGDELVNFIDRQLFPDLANLKSTDKRAQLIRDVFGGNVDDATASTFPVGFRTKESADLFLVMMVNYLKQGGRAAIVLPDGSLTGDGIKARIREMLLRNCNLHTIIRLPNSVFKPYASVATNLLFFEKMSSPAEELEDFATKEIWYYEHQLPEGSKGYSMTRPIRLEDFDKEKEWWKNREESELSWKINLSEVIEKAVQNAKPHYEKEKELKREAYSLKDKLTQLKRVKTVKTQDIASPQSPQTNGKIAKLEKKLQETEANARTAKQTADNIYYGAFDLDYKNSNKVEEDLGDPVKMLEKFRKAEQEMEALQNNILDELKKAME